MSNLTFVQYTGDGTTVSYPFTTIGEDIGYFRASDIHAYVNGEEVQVNIDVNSPHIVHFSTAPAKGSDVVIRRKMPLDKTYADFARGNNFGHRQVNNSFLQQLYLTQEMLDGFQPEGFYLKQDLDTGGHNVTNLGEGKKAGDATEYTQWHDDKLEQDARLNDLEGSMAEGSLTYRRVTFVAKEGQTEFIPSHPFGAILHLFVNGIAQNYGTAYKNVGGYMIRTVPLTEGDEVLAIVGQEPKYLSNTEVDTSYVKIPLFIEQTSNKVVMPIDGTSVLSVYVNGVHMTEDYAYSFDGNKTLTFANALESGDELVVYLGKQPIISGNDTPEYQAQKKVIFTATEGQEYFDPGYRFTHVIHLFVNGVSQIEGEGFIGVGGTLIRTPPLTEGDRVEAIIGREVVVIDFDNIIMTSPNGSKFKVLISNTGIIYTQRVGSASVGSLSDGC